MKVSGSGVVPNQLEKDYFLPVGEKIRLLCVPLPDSIDDVIVPLEFAPVSFSFPHRHSSEKHPGQHDHGAVRRADESAVG